MTSGFLIHLCRCLYSLLKVERSLCFELMDLKLIDHARYATLKRCLANAGDELDAVVKSEDIRGEVYDGTV